MEALWGLDLQPQEQLKPGMVLVEERTPWVGPESKISRGGSLVEDLGHGQMVGLEEVGVVLDSDCHQRRKWAMVQQRMVHVGSRYWQQEVGGYEAGSDERRGRMPDREGDVKLVGDAGREVEVSEGVAAGYTTE